MARTVVGNVFKWIFITLLIALIIVPPVVIYALIYDTRVNEVVIEEGVTSRMLLDRIVTDSLDNTTTEKKVELKVNQQHLNHVLAEAMDKADDSVKSAIKQVDVKIEGNKYTFYTNVEAGIFKTRMTLETELHNETIDGRDAFVFRINKIALGDLRGVEGLATWIITSNVSDADIENSLADYMTVHVDLKGRRMHYFFDDFLNDIQNKVVKEDSSEEEKLYFTLLNDIYQHHVIGLDFEDAITLYVNLNDFISNETYVGGGYDLNLDLDSIATKVEKMVNDDFLNDKHDKNEIENMFNYLVRGYDQARDSEKTYIDSFKGTALDKLSAYGIADYKAYTGEPIPTSPDLDVVLRNNIVSIDTLEELNAFKASDEPVLTYLTEQELNTFLSSLDIVSKSYLTSAFYQDDLGKVNYIVIDNFYANFVKRDGGEYLDFIIGVNINGQDTNFVFSTKNLDVAMDGTTGVSLKFVTEQVYYGTMSGSEALKNALFKLIKIALQDQNTLIFDESDTSINATFTFDEVIQSEMALLGGEAYATVDCPDTIEDNTGRINIRWQNA
jgi:hypothetical protein